MPSVSSNKCVNTTPLEMYARVNEVESYPVYMPLCSEVRVLAWRQPESLRVAITMAKIMIKLSFITENTMEAGRLIRMRLVEGPFKRLHGRCVLPPGRAGIWRADPGDLMGFRHAHG
jgi:ribosome-associated toxin RatA of RatAB toxin-antitoxin module